MPKVSIIIPIYNIEKYLRQCLDSVINQTLKDIEIICVDDGSKDSSGTILDEYASKDSRIKVVHKENGGYGKAMNVGMDHVTGEYVGIVEPDDYVELNMFETLYNTAVKTKVDFVKSDFYQFTEDLVQHKKLLDNLMSHYGRVIRAEEEKEALFTLGMNTWTGIYKTEYIKKYNIRYNETPGARYQDQGFWFQTLIFADTAYFINTPFYHYRFFQTNSTNNPNGFQWIQVEYDYIRDILDKNSDKKEKYSHIYYRFKFANCLLNYCKLDEKTKKSNLEAFRKIFEQDYKASKIDLSAFSDYEREMFKLLINNPHKFYRKATDSLSLLEKIFSITNQNHKKVIRILGLKIYAPQIKPKIQKNKIVFSNFMGKSYGCNPKYITQEILKRKLPYNIVWLVNDPKAERVNFPSQVRLVKYDSEKGFKELLTAKIWVDNTRKPDFWSKGLNKQPEQIYIQTWHGTLGIKKIENAIKQKNSSNWTHWIKNAKIDSQNINYLLTTSETDKKFMRESFWYDGEILVSGYPRNDVLYSSNEVKQKIKEKVFSSLGIPLSNQLVLYCPTFRDDGRTSCFTMDYPQIINALEIKLKKQVTLGVRFHPANESFASHIVKYSTNLINATPYPDIMELLLAADVLITDYSSCIFDFMHLRRPSFIFATDIAQYEQERGFYFPLEDTPFSIATNNDELVRNINHFDNRRYITTINEYMKRNGYADDGHASERVVNLIEKIMSAK